MILGVGYPNTYLGVDRDAGCLLRISGGVDVDRAQAVRMPHDGDPRAILNVADEAVASPRNDQVDVLVELEKCGHFCSGLNGLYVVRRYLSFGQGGLNRLRQQLCGFVRLLSTLQYRSIALKK